MHKARREESTYVNYERLKKKLKKKQYNSNWRQKSIDTPHTHTHTISTLTGGMAYLKTKSLYGHIGELIYTWIYYHIIEFSYRTTVVDYSIKTKCGAYILLSSIVIVQNNHIDLIPNTRIAIHIYFWSRSYQSEMKTKTQKKKKKLRNRIYRLI